MKKLLMILLPLLCGASYGAAVGETDSGEGVVVFNAASTSDLSALDTAYKAADSNLQNQVDGKASLVSTTNTFYNGTNQVWRLTTLTNGIALEVWNTVSNAFVRQTEWTED